MKIQIEKPKKYLPHGAKAAIARETGLDRRVVYNYFKGEEVELNSVDQIEAVVNKYYRKTKVA